ncbi:MAG: DNA topoisomerase 3 [Verrucomicrobiota bacterium]|nr:MAG: DNA topoisomerase 3 [Verrucomicrobiota bacterium]
MKKLVIAEKPSVAQDIADVLGDFQKKDGVFENDDFIISSAVGHIVELYMPEDFNPDWKRWSLDILPIIPQEFKTKPIAKNKTKFNELKKLMHRRDVGTVINACDAGREGELIFTYIYELAGCQKTVERLWLSSMTQEAIREGFLHLRPSSEMQNLQAAARCRSEADWLIGINGTRAITARTARGSGVVTIGRVQTPTLSMILQRENEIRHFQPKPYHRIVADFTIHNGQYQGVYQRPDFDKNNKDPDERIDRLFDLTQADALIEKINASGTAVITEKKSKRKSNPPKLYDLTTLQREAHTRYGMPAGMTLKLAQSLYEKHKCLTYPRTDSNALPEDYPPTCRHVLSSLGGDFTPYAQEILQNNWIDENNRKIFNNKQISDHFAIIPTKKFATNLSDEERKIYTMVVQRFLAVFYPAAEFEITTRRSIVDSTYEFLTEGKILVFPGWLAVYGKTLEDGTTPLPAVDTADGTPPQAAVVAHKEENETRPPARYNEATLLSMMETAGKMLDDKELASAMKERGLGTPATRAQIIDHLIDLRYMERQKKDLVPTPKAEGLFDYLDTVQVQTLSSPTLTGDWEYKLRRMEQGQLDRETFMQGIAEVTREMVDKIKAFDESQQKPRISNLISPTDGKPMLEFLQCYRSQDEQLKLYKVISGRRLLESECTELLQNGTVGPLEGFRSKIGKTFAAKLYIDENHEVKFSFQNTKNDDLQGETLTLEKLKTYPKIGPCPCCGGNVYALDSWYMCEHFLDDPKCPFRLGRHILEQRIDETQAAKLLTEKKSDLLENFCSRRTGKMFSAYLTLDDGGKVGFEFLPRKKKS